MLNVEADFDPLIVPYWYGQWARDDIRLSFPKGISSATRAHALRPIGLTIVSFLNFAKICEIENKHDKTALYTNV